MNVMEESLGLTLGQVLPMIQNRIMGRTSYFGVRTLKNPLDFWVYQELIFQHKPDVILEIGNYRGGSALALAHLCDAMGHGRVIGVDIDQTVIPPMIRAHPRIALREGDACSLFPWVRESIRPGERVMIIEDSAHTYDNTLNVLNTFSVLLEPGDIFIVEDGICHHGLDHGPKPGPYEAVEEFIRHNANFMVDRALESFLITWNPKGFLRRI